MDYLLFAADAGESGGGFLSFCRHWSDLASVLGFVLSLSSVVVALIGFFLTLRGQRKIREATEEALSQAAYQIAVAEVGTLLRQLEGMRDAVRHQLWLPAVFRGGEARYLVLSLSANSTLTANEQRDLSRGDERLRLAVQYVEQGLLPHGHGTGTLASRHRRTLDELVRVGGALRGRLQHTLARGPHA